MPIERLKWINTAEALPPPETPVLCYYSQDNIKTGTYDPSEAARQMVDARWMPYPYEHSGSGGNIFWSNSPRYWSKMVEEPIEQKSSWLKRLWGWLIKHKNS